MAISSTQYIDLLFKKLFGVAKTDLPTNKGASNESIASPPLLRGDIVWTQSNAIPATAQVVSGITQSYLNASAVECSADTTSVPVSSVYPTWKTNLTDWIPVEFGSTWSPKVYVDNASAANVAATGTQIFDAGIGGVGEFYFDPQAGVLNFIGGTIPATLTSSKKIYIVGYRYVGLKGTTNLPDGTVIGNIVIGNTTITNNQANGNITIEPTGTGIVNIDTTTGLIVPVGNTTQRPSPATQGTIRYNTTLTGLEIYNGAAWADVSVPITAQTITPDGSSTVYNLDKSVTQQAVLIITNGIVQLPGTAYTVAGNAITFAEVPQTTDIIDVRFLQ